MSQQFLRRSKDRRLGLEPNSFSNGRRSDAWYSSQIGLEPNSFAVGRSTDVCDSSQLGLESIDSSRLGIESINIFGHILCKEVTCIRVFGTQELTGKSGSKTKSQPLKKS